MVEIIVVIGVLMLLIGISVVAIGKLGKSNKIHHTNSSMETLNAMLQNYSSVDEGMTQILALYGDLSFPLQAANPAHGALPIRPIGSANTALPSPADSNRQISVTTGATGTNFPFPSVGAGTLSVTTGARTSAAWRTLLVMQKLYAVPANRALFDRVPPESRFYLIDSATGNRLQPFLVADGFGEPIYFVPPDGLLSVIIDADRTTAPAANLAFQSDGRRHQWAGGANPGWNPKNANARPFWVSAGPDHDYVGRIAGTTVEPRGDDNVYSFEH
jgi:hypothetical protein